MDWIARDRIVSLFIDLIQEIFARKLDLFH